MEQITRKDNHYSLWRKLAISAILMGLVFPLTATVQAKDKGLESLRATGKAFEAVAKKVSPAVVFIKVEKDVKMPSNAFGGIDPFGDEFFKQFFGPNWHPSRPQPAPQRKYRSVGQGSGFIISKDGYILTNNHVAGDADSVSVTLLDGREFKAKVVGTDPHTDVAVIKIKANNLPVVQLGNSDALEPGEWVLAIGNPFGLSHTVTAGIVSAKGRSGVGVTDYENFIQTDAAINPGNSGGPLVDLDGKVVGINTAIYTRNGGYMGIGFAIPINMAKNVSQQIIKYGHVTRGYVGVIISPVDSDMAKALGMKKPMGIIVNQVSKDSPAQKAGLKQGDIIIALNGKPIKEMGPFRNKIAMTEPGKTVKLTVLRGSRRKTISVKIGKLTDDKLASLTPGGGYGGSSASSLDKLGLTVQNLTSDLAQQFGYDSNQHGVIISAVEQGSDAEAKGIQAGDLIIQVNHQKVNNINDLKRALRRSRNHMVLLLIKNKDYTRYVALRLGQ